MTENIFIISVESDKSALREITEILNNLRIDKVVLLQQCSSAEEIKSNVYNADNVIVLISPSYISTDGNHNYALELVLERKKYYSELGSFILIPILLKNVTMPRKIKEIYALRYEDDIFQRAFVRTFSRQLV